ncbi:hypothetical protein LPW26_03330 [Rhodopseudomonas sp. HC1]|uniref:hypothetical protein n=1 Tax=Rhodopseudomonas infernalis TaxID=2897386 RepID=UPI001EE807DB|nr:hypothetical protein [Rhodopseudomonas infernalis]MCG6203658.1 hypothetical protein [Rhodopseudomonas infernalis]
MERPLPRFVTAKPLKSGATAYYWTLPSYYRKQGCTLHKDHDTALGSDYGHACGEDGRGGKAAVLNALFDEWDLARLGSAEAKTATDLAPFGTVDWLFRAYMASTDWRERVSPRTRPDHERTMRMIGDLRDKKGGRIGDRFVRAITPAAADKLYELIRDTPVRAGKAKRPRTALKAVVTCRHAWRVVRRLYPDVFDRDTPNPWEGVATSSYVREVKPAATRDEVYTFAWTAVAAGHPEAGAAAVICFEWLQRPENVLAGFVQWGGYRSPAAPTQIRIEHHKTGRMVLHPLEEAIGGERVLFYAEAEEILAKVPKLGFGIVMRRLKGSGGKLGAVDKHDPFTMGRIVRRIRKAAGLPDTFTLDACRHGGMTELEEAELTDGQGRALSAHSSKAYEGYAKRTAKRALAATRKRHAYRVAAGAGAAPEEQNQEPISEWAAVSISE